MSPEDLVVPLDTDPAVAALDRLSQAERRLREGTHETSSAFLTLGEAIDRAKMEIAAKQAIMKQEAANAAEVSLALRMMAAQEKAAADAALANAAAQETVTMSFAQQKLILRELVGTVEAASGAHSGMRSIIRMALNPEILALMLTVGALGKVFKMAADEQKAHEDVIREYNKQIIEEAKAIQKLKDAHFELNEQQRKTLATATEIKGAEWGKEYEKIYNDVETLGTKVEVMNGILGKHGTAWSNLTHPMAATQAMWAILTGNEEKLTKALEAGKAALKHKTEETERTAKANHDAAVEGDYLTKVAKHASDIAERALTPQQRYNKALDEQRLLFEQGKISLAQFLQVKANLVVIENDELSRGAKHSSKLIEERQRFYDHMKELDAQAATDRNSREVEKLRAEEAKEIEQANKIIKIHAEREAAIARIHGDFAARIQRANDEDAIRDAQRVQRQEKERENAEIEYARITGQKSLERQLIAERENRRLVELMMSGQITYKQYQEMTTAIGVAEEQRRQSAIDKILIKSDTNSRHRKMAAFELDRRLNRQKLIDEQATQAEMQAYDQATADMKAMLIREQLAQELDYVAQISGSLGHMFGKNKELAYATTVVRGISAAIKSFDNGGGYPTGLAPMAASIATSAAQLVQISSTNIGRAHSGRDETSTGSYNVIAGEMILDAAAGRRARALVDMAEKSHRGSGGGQVINLHFNGGVIGSNQVSREVTKAVINAKRYGARR